VDLYPYGDGEPNEAQIALDYYPKAANKGLAVAKRTLYDMYRYGLMEQVRDEQKVFTYLMRVIQHGDAAYKAKGYSDLAGLFNSGEVSFVKSNKDSVLFYLEKALSYTPGDT
jgi:TPR repeat protein